MARPSRVRQHDLARIVKGALAGGAKVKSVEVDRDGRVVVHLAEEVKVDEDDLDRELEKFSARHDNHQA